MSDAVLVDPIILIGQCVECTAVYRAELPPGTVVSPRNRPWAAGRHGYASYCTCRDGVPCPEMTNGVPSCGDAWCEGHRSTEIKYKVLTVVYKADAVCGPGNCGTAISSKCTCSCRGKNHGSGRIVR